MLSVHVTMQWFHKKCNCIFTSTRVYFKLMMSFLGLCPRKYISNPRMVQQPYPLRNHGTTITSHMTVPNLFYSCSNSSSFLAANFKDHKTHVKLFLYSFLTQPALLTGLLPACVTLSISHFPLVSPIFLPQVLHLMNKMNLPPPFGPPTPRPPLVSNMF